MPLKYRSLEIKGREILFILINSHEEDFKALKERGVIGVFILGI